MRKNTIRKSITLFSVLCLGTPVSAWAIDTNTKKTDESVTTEVKKELEPLSKINKVDSTTDTTEIEVKDSTVNSTESVPSTTFDSSTSTSEESNQNETTSETEANIEQQNDAGEMSLDKKDFKTVPQSAIDDYNYINEYYKISYNRVYKIYEIQDIKKDNNGVIRIPYQAAYDDQVVPIQTTTNFWNAIKKYSNASIITDFVLEGGTNNIIWNYGDSNDRQVDFSNLFSNYSSLKNVDLSPFAWICVTNMQEMFKNCNNLETVKLNINSNAIEDCEEGAKNIKNVIDTSELFRGCTSLKSVEGFTDVDMASNKTCFSMFRDCSNLVNIDNNQLNWYNLNNVSSLSWLFFGCTGLTSLTLNNFSSIPLLTNTSKMFQNCTNISNLDLNNFDTSKVENMSSMFNNCKSLTNLNLNSFNTENVTNMGHMFANCSNLTKLNLQNFKSKNIQYTDHMFLETSKLNYIDLSNFNMTSTINKQNMFFTTSETPLIVLTNDTFLLNYQYSEDHRFPTGPVFDANGGKFDNQQTIKTYFESCAISPQDSKLQLTTFQQFKQDLKPTRDSYLFESWNLTEGNEPTSNTDLFNSATYTAQWTPSLVNGNIPSQDVDNVKPGTTSIYGIAYMPKAFTIPSTKLTDETTQTIPINLTNSYHVAVRDQRMTQGGWTLQAQLVWDNNALKGSYIQTNNGKGEVKKNTNTGSADFQLNDLIGNDETVTGEANVKIGTTPTPIMTGQNVSHNGVYDYDLGQLSLVLENANTIQAGTYTGNINWNLTSAP